MSHDSARIVRIFVYIQNKKTLLYFIYNDLEFSMDNQNLMKIIEHKLTHGQQDFPEILQAVKTAEYKHAAQLIEQAHDEEGIDEIEMMGIFEAVHEIDPAAMAHIRQHIQNEYLQEVVDGYIAEAKN